MSPYGGPGSGIADQGHNGGGNGNQGGGGGGAGAAGSGATGGAGLAVNILNATNAAAAQVGEVSGTDVYYAGGGKAYLGGRGIGGTSASNNSTASPNTGAGGAVAQGYNNASYGATGVVILRMPTNGYSGVTTGSPSVYVEGSDTILVYKTSGTYTD